MDGSGKHRAVRWCEMTLEEQMGVLEDLDLLMTCGDDYNIELSNAARDCPASETEAVGRCFSRVIGAQRKRLDWRDGQLGQHKPYTNETPYK